MTTYEQWRDFHRENPIVFDLFVRFSREAARGGRRHFGARMIGERIRWYCAVETEGDEFKVNNNYWPYYSRLAMLVYPDLAGLFETRTARSDAEDWQILAANCAAVTGQMVKSDMRAMADMLENHGL